MKYRDLAQHNSWCRWRIPRGCRYMHSHYSFRKYMIHIVPFYFFFFFYISYWKSASAQFSLTGYQTLCQCCSKPTIRLTTVTNPFKCVGSLNYLGKTWVEGKGQILSYTDNILVYKAKKPQSELLRNYRRLPGVRLHINLVSVSEPVILFF